MQRIAMATQGADRKAVDFQFLFKLLQRLPVVQHRQFAMGIAGIVAGAELDREDIQAFQFVEHFVEGEVGKKRCENSDLHGGERAPLFETKEYHRKARANAHESRLGMIVDAELLALFVEMAALQA